MFTDDFKSEYTPDLSLERLEDLENRDASDYYSAIMDEYGEL